MSHSRRRPEAAAGSCSYPWTSRHASTPMSWYVVLAADATSSNQVLTTSAQETLVRDFTATWSGALARVNDTIQKLIGSVDAGGAREVLKKAAFQILSLYSRLVDIVRRVLPGTPPFMRDAVSNTVIMREIQRYAHAGQKAAAAAAAPGAAPAAAASGAGDETA